MECRSLDLLLKFVPSKEKKITYAVVTLFNDSKSNYLKYKVDIDTKGNAKLHLTDVNLEAAYIRFQVYCPRVLLPDKNVGKANVLVSELVSGSPFINQEDSATYELTSSSGKQKKGDLELSYKLSRAKEDLAQVIPICEASKLELKGAIGNDIGLFKTVPRFRTPLVSLSFS